MPSDRNSQAPAARPLTTSQPWLIAGISRAAWFRLRAADHPGLPHPLAIPGVRPTYRIADIERWVKSLKPARRKARADAAAAEGVNAETPAEPDQGPAA